MTNDERILVRVRRLWVRVPRAYQNRRSERTSPPWRWSRPPLTHHFPPNTLLMASTASVLRIFPTEVCVLRHRHPAVPELAKYRAASKISATSRIGCGRCPRQMPRVGAARKLSDGRRTASWTQRQRSRQARGEVWRAASARRRPKSVWIRARDDSIQPETGL